MVKIGTEHYYTDIDFFPQQELKNAVKLLEEASILWELYDKTSQAPHYALAQSKAVHAGYMIYEWSNAQPPLPAGMTRNAKDAMDDILKIYAPKKDYRLIDYAWNGIGEWIV
jgi:hypothetical protein